MCDQCPRHQPPRSRADDIAGWMTIVAWLALVGAGIASAIGRALGVW